MDARGDAHLVLSAAGHRLRQRAGPARRRSQRDGDTDEVNRIVSTFVCVYGGLGVLAACAAIGVIAFVVPRFPSLNPSQVRTAQALVAILAFRVAIGFPMTVFGAVTNARQGFLTNNAIAAVVVLIHAALTYVVLAAGGGLLRLVGATTAVNVLALSPTRRRHDGCCLRCTSLGVNSAARDGAM
jgi:hypothetical protein